MSATNAGDARTDTMTKAEFVSAVRTDGVRVLTHEDEEDIELTTEGEGRGTRYFVDGEKAQKAAVESVFETYVDEQGAPVEDLTDDEDEDEGLTYAEAEDRAMELIQADMPTQEDGEILSLVTGEYMGYITGSHVKASPAPITTVQEYRWLVADATDDEIEPDEVPIAPTQLQHTFEKAGQHDEETLNELSRMNRARWEAGEYDHLRSEDDDESDD